MCGRFNLRTTASELAEFFDIVLDPQLELSLTPRFNIAPSQPVLVIRNHADHAETANLEWGLVPAWARNTAAGKRMAPLINARGETVSDKPSFRSAFQHRRCLMPASGFYEWQKTTGATKQPWHIHRPDDALMAFAAIWEQRQDDDGSVIESCAIITTEANSLMAPIHHRMPVVLEPPDFAAWLDPHISSHERLEPIHRLLRPCPDDALVAEPIDTQINRPANEGPDCLRPANSTTSGGDGLLFD
jgi:putative SOS response-associated peptidase YedK